VELPSIRLDLASRNAVPRSCPVIVNPSTIDFGDTPVGASARNSLELINDGKEVAIGTLEVQGGFRLLSKSLCVLAPGEIRSVMVEFNPQKAGAFSGLLTFRGEHTTVSILAARANRPAVLIAETGKPSGPLLPEIMIQGGGTSFQVEWPSEPGKEYQVWYSPDLANWTRAGTPVAARASVASFVDDGSATTPAPVAAPARFYRVGDSNAAVVGFRRIELGADTPLSVPFLKPIVAQGTIASVAAKSLTVVNGGFRANQFRFNGGSQPLTYVLTIASGSQAGRWFVITGNDANVIQVDNLEGTIDLSQLLQAGDLFIIHALHRIADVFGPSNQPVLSRDDRIFLWDVSAQSYETPITLDVIPPESRLNWVQDAKAVDNLPLFPGEGMLVKRNVPGKTAILLAGTVPFTPILQEIVAGNNLVGQAFPVAFTVSRSDLLSSGFAGAQTFSASDKLYVFNARRSNFKSVLWFNTVLDRWVSPFTELNPPQVELAPASAFFIQRNQVRGFEWIQKPLNGN
jgi:hypothetical protein